MSTSHPKAPTTTTTAAPTTTTTAAPTTTTTAAPTTTTTAAPTTTTTATPTTATPTTTTTTTQAPATTTTTQAPATTTTTQAPATTTTTQAPATTTTTQAPTTGLPGPNAYPGFTQVFADDFNGTSLDQTKWNGFYDGENNWLNTHGSVANGLATMSEYQDSANGGNWTGTGMSTLTGWTSGMAFVRARADAGAGITMCIGLIGLNTWPPEIDFYEDFPTTNTRHSFTATTHFGSANSMIWNTNTSVDATQWHTYGVEWNSSTITYFVHGVAWASIPNPSPTGANGFDQPMKLFMQIETGDNTNPSSITPAVVNMNVDWAAVYTPS